MHIISERIAKRSTYTISNMYIDGVKFCNVLEDTDRGLTQDMPIEYLPSLVNINNTNSVMVNYLDY